MSVSDPWNLSIKSNVSIEASTKPKACPPSPFSEALRSNYLDEISKKLYQLCQKRFNIKPPTGACTQWFLEIKLQDEGTDPLLPSNCGVFLSEAFMNDLLSVIPPAFHSTQSLAIARADLTTFATWLMTLLRQNKCDSTSRKSGIRHAREYLEWLRKENRLEVSRVLESHHTLRCETREIVENILRPQLEEICAILYNLSKSLAQKLHGDDPSKQPIAENSLVRVNDFTDQGFVQFTFQEQTFPLNHIHYKKLISLHKMSSDEDWNENEFHNRVWCLLRRYKSFLFCNDEGVDGIQNQAALPIPVFECLHQHFGVTFELFASPFNAYFPQYCSAFTDTDSCFGSFGSALHFMPQSGSFEANPPFNEKLLEKLSHHIEAVLDASELALSFIILLPDFRERPYKALSLFGSSKYKRYEVSLLDQEHGYRITTFPCRSWKFEPEKTEPSFYPTLILFLQNNAGYEQWTPTPGRICHLLEAYRASLTHY